MKKKIFIVSFIIGCIFLVMGFYYLYIKAGIPYQDPTTEMIQEYNRNMRIGEVSILVGFCIEMINIFGIITYVVLKRLNPKK